MSERKGSLVNNIEMDEPLFDGRSQHCVLSTEEERHTASSGCERRHGQKVRNGTREVLAGPSQVSWEREEPSYKETKAKEAGRCRLRHAASYNRNNVEAAMADETAVCAGQRSDQEGSSPSGARMRSTVSESGSEISLADVKGTSAGRVSTVRWDPKGMRRNTGPQSRWSTHR